MCYGPFGWAMAHTRGEGRGGGRGGGGGNGGDGGGDGGDDDDDNGAGESAVTRQIICFVCFAALKMLVFANVLKEKSLENMILSFRGVIFKKIRV